MIRDRYTSIFLAMAVLIILFGCSEHSAPAETRVGNTQMQRAIQSCDLPITASVVAYIAVGRNRFIMTPSADGEFATLTLELRAGDAIMLEIDYTVLGTPYTIATAAAVVPVSGDVEFSSADFKLIDSNMNAVADCIELVTGGQLALINSEIRQSNSYKI